MSRRDPFAFRYVYSCMVRWLGTSTSELQQGLYVTSIGVSKDDGCLLTRYLLHSQGTTGWQVWIMLGGTEWGPWGESLVVDEVPEPEFELFWDFRNMITEA